MMELISYDHEKFRASMAAFWDLITTKEYLTHVSLTSCALLSLMNMAGRNLQAYINILSRCPLY